MSDRVFPHFGHNVFGRAYQIYSPKVFGLDGRKLMALSLLLLAKTHCKLQMQNQIPHGNYHPHLVQSMVKIFAKQLSFVYRETERRHFFTL